MFVLDKWGTPVTVRLNRKTTVERQYARSSYKSCIEIFIIFATCYVLSRPRTLAWMVVALSTYPEVATTTHALGRFSLFFSYVTLCGLQGCMAGGKEGMLRDTSSSSANWRTQVWLIIASFTLFLRGRRRSWFNTSKKYYEILVLWWCTGTLSDISSYELVQIVWLECLGLYRNVLP